MFFKMSKEIRATILKTQASWLTAYNRAKEKTVPISTGCTDRKAQLVDSSDEDLDQHISAGGALLHTARCFTQSPLDTEKGMPRCYKNTNHLSADFQVLIG